MTPKVEQVLAQVRALSREEQQQLWERLKEDVHAAERAARIEASRRIRGKYKNILSGTEEFMARKREEVELEERRYEARQLFR
jgi:metal-dependent amidase/aminoacylase/carboxypeptidase family protein